ncbi:MAG: EAL domain-containing protein, partial [Nitrospinaceae bacterium]
MDLSTGELLLFRAEDFKITQASSLACHETGFNEEEFRGMKFLDLAMKMDPTDLKTLVASLVNKSQPSAVLESPIRRKDGSIYPAEIRFQVVPNAGKAPQILAWLRDMTEHKYMEEAIHQMAYYDSVTGLPNRNLLADRLAVVLTQSRRNRDHVAIIFMDLDHFKIINDTLGHSCGDELLKEVAQRLKTLLRKEDTVARLGGDEFVIVAPAIGQAGSAALLAEKILQQFDEPIVVEGNELYVGASLGVSIFPEDGDKESVLLKNADLALYRAKELGRNNFQLYTPAMNRKVMERVAIQKNLRKAIELDEFELVFQPRVELVSGAIVGVEALVRWNNPELGHMMPSEFIPVAEDTRLIIELGTWTLLQACRDLKIWQDAGLSLSVAVNLSTLQFTHPSLVNEVQSVLEETGVAPDAVELEITETILMKDTDLAIGVLKNLCAKGIRVAIDDFGTGYSSLNYLKNLPIHFLKIDQTFIRDFSQPTNRAIIKTIVSLAHSLGLRTVAEGVETEDQKKFLQSIDCNEAQGYLFSPPLSARGVEELLLSEKKNA